MKSKTGTLVIPSFLIIAALLVIGAITTAIINKRYYTLSKQLQITNYNLLHLEEVRLKTGDMVASSLRYAITGSRSQNTLFYTSYKSLQSASKEILAPDTEATHNYIDSLSLAIVSLQKFSQQIVTAREKEDPKLVNTLMGTVNGENLRSEVHRLINSLESFNRSELRALESEQQSLASNAAYISYFGFSISLLSLTVVFYLLNKELSKRKVAELSLKKLNETLQEEVKKKTSEADQVFSRISDAFIAFDKNWQFTYINKSAAAFIGKDAEELLGKIVWDEFPESVNTSFYHSCYKSMDLQQYVYHEAYYEPWDIYVETRIYPSENGLSVFLRNVSELKKAERKEKKLEEQFKAIVDNTNDIILLANDNGEYIQCNEAACRHLGYTKDEILKLTIYDLIESTHDAIAEELWNEFKENGTSKGLIKLKRKNGKLIECQYSAKDNVQPGVHLSILTDVTKLIKTNKKLSVSQKRYKNAEFIGQLGHWEQNLEDDSIKWSDEVYRIFGISKSVALDYKLFFSFIHPEDQQGFQKEHELAVTGKQPLDAIYRMIRSDGQLRYIHERGKIIKDKHGIPVKLSGVAQDITERRVIEEDTIQSKRRFEAIFNGTNDAILVANDTGKYVQVSPAASRILGYSQEELLNKTVMHLMLDNVNDNDKYAMWEDFKKGGYQTGTIELTRKDKQLITCNYSVTANILPGLHLSIFTDITDKYKAEQELQLSYHQLKELTGRLQIVREEERIHIAREIHDELGQKLTGIKIDTSWLGKKIEDNEDAKKKIGEIMSLIDDTIDTTRRISSELRPGLLEYFGLIVACESQSKEFEKRHQIKSNFVSEISTVNFSFNVALGIYRIYQEALTNIARHAQATLVETLITQVDNHFILTVKDNGCGFDQNEIKKKHSLGLVGMRERANLVLGELAIESNKGAGTSIWIKIPLDQELSKS
ncbi:MAG: PAS domain S-box protein [Cyclobacteriaceae bacterium]|nr:PAS domain S-box protein [Cyclobacteriaceae bacterium]